MSNRQRVIVTATLFNILFEYSMRGINNLPRQPLLPLLLIAVYASLFTMQDDLIRRFKLKDCHLVILAFTYGIVHQCLVSGAAFIGPTFFGINWLNTGFVIVVWWGILQSVVTFYIANRVTGRDKNASPLSLVGWVLALAVNIGAVVVFQVSGKIPAGRPVGYVVMIVTFVVAAFLFQRTLPPRDALPHPFEKRTVMDIASVLTVAVFVFSALFVRGGSIVAREASLVNLSAVRLVTGWTIVLAVVVVAYRLIMRRPIPV